MPTVLLYGLGAIGGFYAFILSRNKDVELDVVARSNYDAVKQNGLEIYSANHGEHIVQPRNVFKSPSEATQPYDYVVCAHKALKLDNVIPDALSPAIGPATTIVIIQNGVGNEDPFRARYPSNTIISCVTWVGATQSSPGVIQHMKSENTELGLFPNPSASAEDERAKLDTFTQLLTTGGTPFTVEEDIQTKRWEKVVWNCAWNPLTTLTLLDTHSFLRSSPTADPMTRSLMHEVISIARACNVPMRDGLVEELMDKIYALPGIGSSMQTDARAGRGLEVDVIVGVPWRRAGEVGMQESCKVLGTVYSLITAVNLRLERTGK